MENTLSSTQILTSAQRRVLAFVQDFQQHKGMTPTRVDIAQAMGWRSANAAEDHLRALERKGYITIAVRAARGLRLTHAALALLGGYPPMSSAGVPNLIALPVVNLPLENWAGWGLV